jgi:hypothetical protein
MSERKKKAALRRDERNARGPEILKTGSSRRNTKRWCRGVVGRAHKPVCYNYAHYKNPPTIAKMPALFDDWRILVCDVCKKELAHYFMGSREAVPDWVTGVRHP